MIHVSLLFLIKFYQLLSCVLLQHSALYVLSGCCFHSILRPYIGNLKICLGSIRLTSFNQHFQPLRLGSLDSRHQLRRRFLAIALRVIVDPAPQVVASLFHSHLGLPLELLVGKARVGGKVENVALAAGDDFVGQLATDDGAKGLDHFKDGAAATRAQVPRLDTGLVFAEVVEGSEMALGEVDDVDVVADGSAVTGGVVYGQRLAWLYISSVEIATHHRQRREASHACR